LEENLIIWYSGIEHSFGLNPQHVLKSKAEKMIKYGPLNVDGGIDVDLCHKSF